MDKRSWLDYYGIRYGFLNNNPQYLAAVVERAHKSLLVDSVKRNTSAFDIFTKTFTDIDVQQDENETWYSEVPVKIVKFLDDANSVRRITAKKDQTTIIFVPVPKDSWSTFSLLDVDKVIKYVPFSLTNNRVEYAKKPPITQVSMDLVRTFTDYEDNEEVALPESDNGRYSAEEIFEQRVNMFINGTPEPNKVNV